MILHSRFTIVLILLIALPGSRLLAQSTRPYLQQRIQSHAEPEEIPPPGTTAIQRGVISILTGAALTSGGTWASILGIELHRQADELHNIYMQLDQTATLQDFTAAHTAYAEMQQQSIYYRIGGATGIGLGISGITYGMLQIRSAARQSRLLAEENHIELTGNRRTGLSGGRLIIEPRGVSLLWNY